MTTDIPNYTLVLQECLDKIKMYGVIGTVEDVRRKNKKAEMVFLRAAVAGYLRSLDYSYEKIGLVIARRPAAVMNLIKKAKRVTPDQKRIIENISDESKRDQVVRELIRYHEGQLRILKDKQGL